jgi:AcrR family transcriptional regulator
VPSDTSAARGRSRPPRERLDTEPPTATSGDDSEAQSRRRLLNGLMRSIREKGFRETTVSDIVRYAYTSRRTFYAEFATREECYIALIDASDQELSQHIMAAVDVEAPWEMQVRQAVTAYIEYSQANPELTLTGIRDLPALGEAALLQQRGMMDTFADMLIRLTHNQPFRDAGIPPFPRDMAFLLVGGIRELTAVLVEDGRDLREMTETIIEAATGLLHPR